MEQMRQQRGDIEYHIINLMAKWESDPQGVQSMLDELLAMFQPPQFLSPMPHKCFKQERVVDAFRYMQQGKHLGKIVVALEEKHHQNAATPFAGTHIITGGLGAIGLKIARHLITQDCTSIVLLARRSPSPELEEILAELRATGAIVRVVYGDVADRDLLTKALTAIRQTMLPIKGIYHAAGITDDGLIGELDRLRFEKVFQSKIAGTYLLHQLTLKDDLRYFVLFSSMTSMLGTVGVANYAAANAAMNSFAYYRNRLGLPATAIAWGPWANTGMFEALDPVYRDHLSQSGLHPLSDEENCQSFTDLISQPGVFGVFQIQWHHWLKQQTAQNNPLFEKLSASSKVRQNTKDKSASDLILIGQHATGKIMQKLQELSPRQRQQKMYDFLQKQLSEILALKDSELIDENIGFFDLGMDSLTSVEFRNRLQSRLSCPLPITVTYDYPSIRTLSGFLLEQIQPKQANNSTSEPQHLAPASTNNEISKISAMSEMDIIAELTK